MTVAACGEDVSGPKPTAAALRASAAPQITEEAREDALAVELARQVALGLRDKSVRDEVKTAMRASRFKSHQLEFRRFLKTAGGISLSESARAAGGMAEPQAAGTRGGATIAALADSLPSLQFSLPVRAHRAKWTGDGDILVVAALRDGSTPVAFTPAGERIELSRTAIPQTPLLVLTLSETNFDRPVVGGTWHNVEDANGASVGTLVTDAMEARAVPLTTRQSDCAVGVAPGDAAPSCVPVCDPYAVYCEEPPPAPPPPAPPSWPDNGTLQQMGVPQGIYMWAMHVNDYAEPFWRDEPEIEIMVFGQSMNPDQWQRYDCAGDREADPWERFNLDGHTWNAARRLNGEQDLVRLVNASTLRNYMQVYGPEMPVEVMVWEDDNAQCEVRSNEDYGSTLFNMVGAGFYAHEYFTLGTGAKAAKKVFYPVAAAYYLGKVYSSVTRGYDTLLGRAVFSPSGGNTARLIRTIPALWTGTTYWPERRVDNGWIDLQVAWW